MKKTLAALTLGVGLVLSGCAGWSAPETPEQIVFSAKSTYAGLAATAGVYESLPRCDEVEEKVCSERDIVSAIRKADNAAYSSLQTAEEIVRDEDGVFSAATKESTAQNVSNVLKNFRDVLVEFGVLDGGV